MKKFISMVTAIAMIICAVYIAPISAGAEDALKISTAQELKAFADSVNGGNTYEGKTITLENDIDLSAVCGPAMGATDMTVSWTPIGDFDKPFDGIFDGTGHTISRLYINAMPQELSGLFGWCGKNSKIRNLAVDGSITVSYPMSSEWAQPPFYIGGAAGMSAGRIENCHNKAAITGTGSGAIAAGICGALANGCEISGCVNTGVIKSDGSSSAISVDLGNDDFMGNCYYLEGTATDDGATAKTAEQFASGEVAYLLGSPWGQRIGVDEYPVIGGDRVYLANGEYTNVLSEYPYTINSLKLVSASGEEYGEIPTGTGFIAQMDVTKVAERNGQDYFIAAAYGENNKLVSMNYIKADLPTGTSFSCGVNIPKTDELIETVKAFVWDGLGTAAPLAETHTISSDAKFLEDRVLAAIYDVPEMTGDAGSFYLNYLNEKLPELDLKYCNQLVPGDKEEVKPCGIYLLGLNTAGKQQVYDAIELLMTLDIVRSAQPDYIAHPED